jgi:hypothetical protein
VNQEIKFRSSFRKRLLTKIKKLCQDIVVSWVCVSIVAIATYQFIPRFGLCFSLGYIALYIFLIAVALRRRFDSKWAVTFPFPTLLHTIFSFFLGRFLLGQ